jgi:high-affinity Fe2+/Pb2+ permease
MTQNQYNEFLYAVVIICAFGAMLNLGKLQSRGPAAGYLIAAFIALGITVYLIRLGVNQYFIDAGGAVVFGLLGADFAHKIKKQAGSSRK